MDEIKANLDADGRVIRCSAKLKKRLYAVRYIAEKFEADREYTEQEVNEIIKNWVLFSDYVLIRREMIDYAFMSRRRDGTGYRRADELPDVQMIIDGLQ